MQRGMMRLAGGGSAVVLGFLLAARQPQPASAHAAGFLVQATFFAAVIGLQVAMVAGLRYASLAIARRHAAVSSADQQVLHNAAVICAVGLVVALAGWLTALLVVFAPRSTTRLLPLTAGIALMVAGTILAVSTARRATPPSQGNAAGADKKRFVLGWGERAVTLIRRYPIVACAGVVAVGTFAAMSGAESTVVGSLPVGVLEAIAIVAGFTFLGPRLGLRTAA